MQPAHWILLVSGLLLLAAAVRTQMIIRRYAPSIRRAFEETPIFAPTEGVPHPAAEEVEFQTPDGLTLRGSYLHAAGQRPKGLIVFCHEYLSDRWSGISYWEFLQRDGFDIFAFDFRNHGSSDTDPTYKPRHWVTNADLTDLEAALRYVRSRVDSAELPIGLFGISRGGGAAIGVAARDRDVRCVVTDGAFPTYSTMLTYMKKWMWLYTGDSLFYKMLPDWYIWFVGRRVLSTIERDFGCRFVRLERAIARLAPRPTLMIHGGRDSYIRPEMARQFYECAREPREFWVVEGARHNACLETAGDEYRHKVRDFFRAHLSPGPARPPRGAEARPSNDGKIHASKNATPRATQG
jgi:pimeloyl-ACP methyl ester carboxylesterase